MSDRTHTYDCVVTWTGNRGTGTSGYRAFDRAHEVTGVGRPGIPGSSDPAFRGDPARWNPEQLLVVSLSQCHMLWYLHLATEAGVVVTAYSDHATATMAEEPGGAGQFVEATLHPVVTVADPSMVDTAHGLHEKANEMCFIARSVNFPVHHESTVDIYGT
jgi:organic hydroperoxide reductase OsmC/OhrA